MSGLLNLLTEDTLYGANGIPGSKSLKDSRSFRSGGPLLGPRVSFSKNGVNFDDPQNLIADPNFEHGRDHGQGGLIDSIVRGGLSVSQDRRDIDLKRIGNFLLTNNGIQWIATQVALQSQNKRKNQRIFNLGVNTLQSVATAGISNVKRQGLLSLGGFDVAGALGARQGYIDDKEFDSPISGSTETIGGRLREIKYNLGDPGKISPAKGFNKLFEEVNNPFAESPHTNYDQYNISAIDKLNAMPIVYDSIVGSEAGFIEDNSKDFVKFRFEVLNFEGLYGNASTEPVIIAFRAYLDTLSDSFNAQHNEFKYNGRGEPFYTYKNFGRKINIGFKIAAQTRFEMQPLYNKLNFLAAQTAPNYSPGQGRIRTPYMNLTLGNWFRKLPGVLKSVNLTWQKNYPWEIKADTGEAGKDNAQKQVPHVLDVSVSFQPIHNFVPTNSPLSEFIGVQDWLESPKTALQWAESTNAGIPTAPINLNQNNG